MITDLWLAAAGVALIGAWMGLAWWLIAHEASDFLWLLWLPVAAVVYLAQWVLVCGRVAFRVVARKHGTHGRAWI